MNDLRQSCETALGFLERAQLPSGEFSTLLASDPSLEGGIFDSSPFVTSFVVHALREVGFSRADAVAERAAGFLRGQMTLGGLWRYYAKGSWKHCRVPPDLDDTACCSVAVTPSGVRPPRNRWIFAANRDDQGRYLTWVIPGGCRTSLARLSWLRWAGDAWARARLPARPAEFVGSPRFHSETDPAPPDDVDPVVNANAIMYLGESPETAAAIAYVIETVERGITGRFSLYYTDPLALYHAVARAHRFNCPAFAAVKRPIVAATLEHWRHDGSFGSPLSTALAVSTLLTFAPDESAIDAAIGSLLHTQTPDGSWPAFHFYSGPAEYWGSRELTTGLCLEALVRFSHAKSKEVTP
jgi:hypothetical protein